MSDSPREDLPPEKPELPRIDSANHANIIAENLRRIDAALPPFPIKPERDLYPRRGTKHGGAPQGPHQPSALSPEDTEGR